MFYKTKRRPESEMIFGTRAIIEAVKAGKNIEKILIRRDMTNSLSRELYAAVGQQSIPIQKVPAEKLDQMTTKNHQGVVAFISPVTYQSITDIIPTLYEQGRVPFVVLLDGITDVRNFGAIARTCECAGVDAIVVGSVGNAAANADAIKTSAGALLTIPVCRELNLAKTVKFLADSGLKAVAVTEKTDCNYTQLSYTEPVALVLGAEDEGISPEVLRVCSERAAIPLFGSIQSLNVSVAAGVLMYEVIRQREK
ncbi:MAG: 23S rRNA (guanosine(2251)-2'-O)-methyltransferase RlmB [Prevotellaceae bacterium]|jgi:23S rRNA (guanosine2251-2'-O)-methyltransferase|nr:23S rRNA (guanosine(2251)-2'-O)-methyltransferase RlmB [Prevotellaceae bacterium]